MKVVKIEWLTGNFSASESEILSRKSEKPQRKCLNVGLMEKENLNRKMVNHESRQDRVDDLDFLHTAGR